jgi:hypothetical protein
MSNATLDRREFIAAAAAAAAACLPVAMVAVSPPADAASPRVVLEDWHVDDMWGVYPRPHEAIGYGRPHGDGELVAAVHPADRAFLA